MIMEEWRIIKAQPDYEVSNYGRVRSIKRNKIIFLKTHTAGYKTVVLYNKNKKKYYYVHRLVAEAFIPNPNNLPMVNHKDEDKQNNHVENLEWCTTQYNTRYGTATSRMGLSHSKRVRQYTKDGVFLKEWRSYQEAEECLGLRQGIVSMYVNSPFHWEKV